MKWLFTEVQATLKATAVKIGGFLEVLVLRPISGEIETRTVTTIPTIPTIITPGRWSGFSMELSAPPSRLTQWNNPSCKVRQLTVRFVPCYF